MITGSEIDAVWLVVGKAAAIIAVIVGIIQGVHYLVSLMPTAKLEKRVSEIEVKSKKDYEHLQAIDLKISALEQKINDTESKLNEVSEGIQRIGKSQISLLRHFVTGNGQKEMADEADDLTDWFIDR